MYSKYQNDKLKILFHKTSFYNRNNEAERNAGWVYSILKGKFKL